MKPASLPVALALILAAVSAQAVSAGSGASRTSDDATDECKPIAQLPIGFARS